MKSIYGFLFVCLFFQHVSLAQLEFEKGYFIDNQDEKTECLIRDEGWKNNPKEFEYRTDENSGITINSIQNVKEFAIYDHYKYIRTELEIDKSSTRMDQLTYDRNPNYVSETLFLKVIVEGPASLYEYEENAFTKYFFKTSSQPEIIQLFYKEFLNQNDAVSQNNAYLQQIWNSLKCETIKFDQLNHLRYSKNPLEKVFLKYNNCIEPESSQIYEVKREVKEFLRIKVRGGYVTSDLILKYPYNLKNRTLKIDGGSGFSFGGELEYVLPLKKNKWSLISYPTYIRLPDVSYSNEEQLTNFELKYSTIEIPFGLRYYSFLSNNFSLCADFSLIIDSAIDGDIIIGTNNKPRDFELEPAISFQAGLGLSYNNQVSVDLKYGFGKELIRYNINWGVKYVPLSVNVYYRVF